jgi:hypothetical protein
MWMEEIKKHGNYDLTYNQYGIDFLKTGTYYGPKEENPYIEAFWRWWPSLKNDLHTLRITGGEPLMNPGAMQFFDLLEEEPSPHLEITINSFSYKKGIPSDSSENGGGFVFDMRGILNPGRVDEYKKQSGLDKPVQDFLEQRTKMNSFLNSVWDLIDITVEDYLKRGFTSLHINFGCTGGQHRSVFAAEQTARHLRNKYKIKVLLAHTNKENWVK